MCCGSPCCAPRMPRTHCCWITSRGAKPMIHNVMVDYTVFYLVVVVLAAAVGSVGTMLLTDRRHARAELAADMTAADTAPVPAHIIGGGDVTRPALPPTPRVRERH